MPVTMTQQATVLPGHRIEIVAPELPEGANVEVQITLPAFAQWAVEDAQMTPEAITAEDAAYTEIEANSPLSLPSNTATLALLDAWDTEDAAMTEEETARASAEWQEMQTRLDERLIALRIPTA